MKTEWISVDDKPLIIPVGDGTWEITKEGAGMFIVLIPILNRGIPENFIAWCYIDEGTIDLCYVGDGEDTGWDATGVTHYIPMQEPEPPKP